MLLLAHFLICILFEIEFLCRKTHSAPMIDAYFYNSASHNHVAHLVISTMNSQGLRCYSNIPKFQSSRSMHSRAFTAALRRIIRQTRSTHITAIQCYTTNRNPFDFDVNSTANVEAAAFGVDEYSQQQYVFNT